MITIWMNDVVRYAGEPRDGLTPGELYRIIGDDHTRDADEPATLWPLGADGPTEYAREGELVLVASAPCHDHDCDGSHPTPATTLPCHTWYLASWGGDLRQVLTGPDGRHVAYVTMPTPSGYAAWLDDGTALGTHTQPWDAKHAVEAALAA